jgi:hypothetical protein
MPKTRNSRVPLIPRYFTTDGSEPPALVAAENAAAAACGNSRPAMQDYGTALQRAADATARLLLTRAIIVARGNPERAQALLSLTKRKYYIELQRLGLTDLPAKVRAEAERVTVEKESGK